MRAPRRINVAMCQLDALLVPGISPDGHRGLWFYDPDSIEDGLGEVVAGDVVHFTKFFSEIVAVGTVVKIADPESFPKLCSRVNSRGFWWIPDDRAREQLVAWINSTAEEHGLKL